MNFVPNIRDELVTELMYRRLPSWHAVGCYFDWRAHYAVEQRRREGIGRRDRHGRVLTEQGWLIPPGPENPRILEEPGDALVSIEDAARQAGVDREVARAREDHEAAVLSEDMAIFTLQWEAITNQKQQTRRALLAVKGRSEERETFIARWKSRA